MLSKRLKQAMKAANMTQAELARSCGVKPPSVSGWLSGKSKFLRGENLISAASALGVCQLWLATGKGPMNPQSTQQQISTSNVEDGPSIIGKVPLISWVKAGSFCTSPELFEPGDAEEWLPAVKRFGPHAYALRVIGDSMVLPYPSKDSFFPGTIIFVDPDKPLTNGAKVIAKIDATEEATFKVFSEDGGKRYLKPQNPQYPVIEMDETMHICGVVVWQGGDV